MIGQKILHYEVTKRLGTGGQATAYLAKDTKLARAVVLKLLESAPTASDASRKRFLREARLAATLDHPSICTIHDIQEADGHYFIVMQYVDGETLKSLVARERLPIETTVAIAVQVADGLAAAHRAGVVHRDVKPANIMVSSAGRAIILDFGLSKATTGENRRELDVTETTGGGKPFGTPTSMSPEQVRGELDVDARSDVFSLGIVLYEMVTGAKPFLMKTSVETMNAVLNLTPRSIQELNPQAPASLVAVINRSLEKKREDRYPSAIEMHADLHAVATEMGLRDLAALPAAKPKGLMSRLVLAAVELINSTSSLFQTWSGRSQTQTAPSVGRDTVNPSGSLSRTRTKLSLTILPLKNIGQSPEYENFGTGLADTLITELAVVGDLFVRPLRTVLKYATETVDPLAVGQEMGVDVVLDGSFQVSGETLRATLRLFDVRTGDDIWTERFDQPLADLFALQDQVARRVIEGLRIHLTDYEKEKLRAPATGDVNAFDNFIKAKFLFERSHARRDYDDAIALFQKTIDADPGFAPAYSGLGRLYLMLWFIYRSDITWLDDAEAASKKAISIDPRFAESYSVLGSVALERGLKDEAYDYLKKAVDLAPNDLEAHIALGWLYRWSGLLERALKSYKTAVKIDPGYWRNTWGLVMTYVFLGRLEDAEKQLTYFLTKVDPQHPVLRFVQGDVAYYLGNYELAEKIGAMMKTAAPDQPFGAVLLAKVLAAQGESERAAVEMTQVTRMVGPRGDSFYWLAQISALRGDVDDAVAQFLSAIESGNENLPWFEQDESLDSIRNDPRFVEAMDALRTRYAEFPQRFGS